MRNPNRTTKMERRKARINSPNVCRQVGVAETARAWRIIDDPRTRIALLMDVNPQILHPTLTGVNHWSEYLI